MEQQVVIITGAGSGIGRDCKIACHYGQSISFSGF